MKILRDMKNIKSLATGLAFTLLAAGGFTACSDLLNVEPQDVLTEDQFYRDKFDADAALRGLYGKLFDLGPQLIVLNELRADLLDVTSNADHHLRELSNHGSVSADNPWVDPKPFYSLINNCNNVIENFDRMKLQGVLDEEAYNARISDVIVLRSWLYYQLVLHYGEVPYITEPVETFEDLEDISGGQVPVLGVEDMMARLYTDIREKVPSMGIHTDESLYRVIDGFHTRTMYIDRAFFWADLLLWQGDYTAAASVYKYILERHHGGYSGYNEYDQYKLPFRDNSRADNPGSSKYTSGYLRYFDSDLNSVVNFWPLMFSGYGDANYYGEWIWVLNYHRHYKPSPFYDLFSLQQGEYKLKPSESIIKNWNEQVQANGFLGDFRGNIEDIFENTGSYRLEGSSPVITKFIGEYDELNPLERPGRMPFLRAAGVHLRYAEAANRAGQTYLASAILNNGVRASYPGSSMYASNDYTFRNISYATDAFGNIEYEYIDEDQDGIVEDSTMILLPAPFNFDARQTSDGDIPSIYRGEWHRGVGVRGRVSLAPVTIPDGEDPMLYLEEQILAESGRELAFEGQRWADLVRIAIRRGDPAFLADRVAQKFEAAGDAGKAVEVRNLLMNRENWFLPLDE